LDSDLFDVGVPVSVTAEQAQTFETARAALHAVAGGSLDDVTATAMDTIYNEILEQHNTYRSRHQAQPLSWSNILAAAVDGYASRCIWAHDPDANAGENMYVSGNKGDIQGALRGAIISW
jgi:hypothetical protein